jgi:hypothetical protein
MSTTFAPAVGELDKLVALASDPETPLRELKRLAALGPELRRAIAGNPNANDALLVQCGSEFPHVFAANPVLKLWALVRPDWYKRCGEGLALALIRQLGPACPEKLEEILPLSFRLQLARRIKAESLTVLWADPSAEVRSEAAFQGYLRSHARNLDEENALRWANDTCPIVLRRVAAWPGRSEDFYRAVVTRCDADAATALAKNVETAVLPALRSLLGHADPAMRKIAVACERLSEWELKEALSDESPKVRVALAKRVVRAWETFKSLAADPDGSVRAAVAASHTVPTAWLERFVRDEHEPVRLAALNNRKATVAVMIEGYRRSLGRPAKEIFRTHCPAPLGFVEWLWKEGEDRALAMVIEMGLGEDAWIERVAAHPNRLVRMATVRRLKRCHKVALSEHLVRTAKLLACDSQPQVRRSMVGDPRLEGEDCDRLAADPDEGVRRAVARKLFARTSALIALGADPSPNVRLAVAKAACSRFGKLMGNRRLTPRDAVEFGQIVENWALRCSLDEAVVFLELHRRVPFAALGALAERFGGEPGSLQDLIVRGNFPADFCASLGSMKVSKAAVSAAARSANVFLQAAAARHFRCTPRLWLKLAQHPHPLVRLQALRNPARASQVDV